MMFTHSVLPEGLFLSTCVYIPKNKRCNKCDFNNYRQIAISCLLGKYSRLILDSYLRQFLCVMWESCKSEQFQMDGWMDGGWGDFMSFI